MKKLVLFAVFGFILCACSKDDDDSGKLHFYCEKDTSYPAAVSIYTEAGYITGDRLYEFVGSENIDLRQKLLAGNYVVVASESIHTFQIIAGKTTTIKYTYSGKMVNEGLK